MGNSLDRSRWTSPQQGGVGAATPSVAARLGGLLLGALLSSAAVLGALLSSAALVGCHPEASPTSPSAGIPDDCATRPFSATEVQRGVRPSIVRVVAGEATGTGFVLEDASDAMLIVTNHHVIAEGDTFRAIFPSEEGKGTELGGLEVVKVDIESDLALLRGPKLAGNQGLRINPQGVELGQRVAAMGYPFVAGSRDFTLTFEPGDVSAVKRVINEREFVQTNANINPGNSGGPVVDACGTVVGVVVATSAQAERVGLVVPVKRLLELRNRYHEKPPPPEKGIRVALRHLEKAVQYKRGKDAAALFSRGFVRSVVMPDFRTQIIRAETREQEYAKLLAARGVDYFGVDVKTRMQFLREELPRPEFEAWLVAQLLRLKRVGIYEAMGDYLSFWITDMFGDVQSLTVDEVSSAGDGTGRANVKVTLPGSATFWEFEMVHEWGDWRIEKPTCLRGCAPPPQ